jgi:hypothetical protein
MRTPDGFLVEVISAGEERDIEPFRDESGRVTELKPVEGSDRAFLNLRLPNGLVIHAIIPIASLDDVYPMLGPIEASGEPAVLYTHALLRDDDEMPKVNPPATTIKKFEGLMQGDFQQRFDAWKAEVESAGRGTIEITHEEIVSQGAELLIFWRLVPHPAIARRR